MKGVLLKKLLLAGSYFVVACLVEMITFLMMGFGALPKYVWLDVACILIVTAVVYIIPSFRAQSVVIVALLILQCFLSVVNQILYDMSGFVFVLSLFSVANAAVGAFRLEYLNFYIIGIFLVILALEITYVTVICRRVKVKCVRHGQTTVLVLFLALLVAGLSELLYFTEKSTFVRADDNDPMYIYKDDGYLYSTQFVTAKALRSFGTFSFYYKNIANFIADIDEANLTDEDVAERVEALHSYFAEGSRSSSLEDLDLSPYGGSDQIMTGMLDGQNIVLIVIESGEWYGINSEYTPTLYALASQGVAMTNYITRDKTNHSEAMSVLGSYPIEDKNSFEAILEKYLAFSLPNIVKNNGYTTNYFHTGNATYYNRNESFGGGIYGFEHAAFADTLEKINGYYDKNGFYDFDRDSEMISQYLDAYTRVDEEDSAFYTQMMTLISHGSYEDLISYGDYSADWTQEQKDAFSAACTVKELEIYYERIDDYPALGSYIDEKFALTADKYEEESSDGSEETDPSAGEETGEPVPTDVYLRYKRYQAGLMDLDVGVNRLLHELQQSGELSNTTFVFYADHNAYYSDQVYALKNVKEDQVWNLKLYNIPFFFWSGKYMSLSVESDLYDGVAYVKDDLTEEMMEESGLTEADFYDGAFYYAISHSAQDDSYAFLRGAKIEKFCDSFDVLPTLLDLLGYDYNLNLYHGYSVFDEPESLFVSRESGMFKKYIYTSGDDIYVQAKVNENGSVQSMEGDILFFTDSDGRACVTVWNENGEVTYLADEVKEYMYVLDDYIVYSIDSIFMNTSDDRRELFSKSVFDFMVDLSSYYEKQEKLEEMYFLDYFRHAPFDELVEKIV